MTVTAVELTTSAEKDDPKIENVKSKDENGKVNNVLNNIPTLSPCTPSTPSSLGGVKKAIQFSVDHSLQMNQHNNTENLNEKEDKIDEILDCLNGIRRSSTSADDPNDDEKVVDLWHLRELAISQHGLVTANIRKRAWPKLVGANEHILNASIASIPTHFSQGNSESREVKSRILNDLPEGDVMMIKKDISECIWNIEEEIKMVRKKREEQKEKKHNTKMQIVFKKEKMGEDASIASLDSGFSSLTTGRITPQLIPEAIRAFPRFGPSPAMNTFPNQSQSPNVSGTSTPVSGIATPNTLPSITPIGIQNMSINENSDVSSKVKKSKARYLRKRKEEQALLLNIITSVLRAVPDDDEPSDVDSDLGFDDDTVLADNIKKLYYFKGMHNLVGAILITLESPSLTSLVINRLAQSHLRDAMGSTFENIQAGIRLIFVPLLEKVDKSLHDYLINGGVQDPCIFVLQWVLCWFTTDVPKYDFICRLFDVFIASHASFPVYFSVALLTHTYNKSRIMMTPCEASALETVLFNLPSTFAENVNSMDMLEEMIETSLSYMQSMPVQKLLVLCKNNKDDIRITNALRIANSVSLLRGPPHWAYASSTATDWTLIKQAKALRGLSPVSRSKKQRGLATKNTCENRSGNRIFVCNKALDASGLSRKKKESIKNVHIRQRWATKVVLFLLVVAIGLSLVKYNSIGKDGSVKIKPSKEKASPNITGQKKETLFNFNLKNDSNKSRNKKKSQTEQDKSRRKPGNDKSTHKPTGDDGSTLIKKNEKDISVQKTPTVRKIVQKVKNEEGNDKNWIPTAVSPAQDDLQQSQAEKVITRIKLEKSKESNDVLHGEPIQNDSKQGKELNPFGRAIKSIKKYLEDDKELLIVSF